MRKVLCGTLSTWSAWRKYQCRRRSSKKKEREESKKDEMMVGGIKKTRSSVLADENITQMQTQINLN